MSQALCQALKTKQEENPQSLPSRSLQPRQLLPYISTDVLAYRAQAQFNLHCTAWALSKMTVQNANLI